MIKIKELNKKAVIKKELQPLCQRSFCEDYKKRIKDDKN